MLAFNIECPITVGKTARPSMSDHSLAEATGKEPIHGRETTRQMIAACA